jgi:Tfp pilus assembly protein PilV
MITFKAYENGQSLFEIVFVIAITALILVGVVSLSVTNVRNTDTSSNQVLSARYSRETLDWLRQQRDISWNNLASHSGDSASSALVYCLKNLPTSWPVAGSCVSTNYIPGTNLLREAAVQFTDVNENKIRATVSIRWIDTQGTHERLISTTFVDWSQVENLRE